MHDPLHSTGFVPAPAPDPSPLSSASLPARPPRKEVLASGDNHGCDPSNLKEDLAKHGALDAAGRLDPSFTGTLVQIGDTVDRGAYSREIFDLWRDLQRQAPDRVVRLLGNHEMYHLAGAPGIIGAAPIAGLQEDLIDDIKAGKIVAAWAEGDVLYTHAGLDLDRFPEYAGKPLDEIVDDLNRRLREAVDGMTLRDPWHNLLVFDRDPIFSAGPAGDGYGGGIFWARQDIDNPEFRQVVGHTPQKDGIKAEPGRRVKYIDAGRARGEHRPGEAGERARELMENTLLIEKRQAP